MNTCPSCNKEVATDATICPHCGHHIKKEKHLETLLKRSHATYYLDLLIMVLPLSLIALFLIKQILLVIAIPISLLTMIWGILSIRKRKKNNKIIKDLIYLNKEDNTLTLFTIDNREHTFPIHLISKISKDNLITQRVYATIKEANKDHITYHTYKLDLGYAKVEEVKKAQAKLKDLVEVSITIEG